MIQVPRVRLVDENGSVIGVIDIEEARRIASERGLDLVEVASKSDPPVCKLLNYGKFKYLQKKKVQRSRRKQHVIHIKEIRLRPRTSEHDINIKLKHAREFLQKGNKVTVTMFFRGRELLHTDLGKATLDQVYQSLQDIAKIERGTELDGNRLSLTLVPKQRKEKGDAKTEDQQSGAQEVQDHGHREDTA
jgi:translation initiation factor IF-3